MSPLEMRDELRNFLNSGQVTLAKVTKDSGLSLSWLSKFRRGCIRNPGADQLATLYEFKQNLKQ